MPPHRRLNAGNRLAPVNRCPGPATSTAGPRWPKTTTEPSRRGPLLGLVVIVVLIVGGLWISHVIRGALGDPGLRDVREDELRAGSEVEASATQPQFGLGVAQDLMALGRIPRDLSRFVRLRSVTSE